MKTPIQELIEYMDLISVPKELDKDIQSALTQFHTHLMYKINDLLEKENQMIVEARTSKDISLLEVLYKRKLTSREHLKVLKNAEQYYNKTFKND